MLQHDEPGDFVVATGESHSVRGFWEEAFGNVGLDWRQYVEVDSAYFRPVEVDYFMRDYSKARAALAGETQNHFHQLVQIMMNADLRLAEEERALRERNLAFRIFHLTADLTAKSVPTDIDSRIFIELSSLVGTVKSGISQLL